MNAAAKLADWVKEQHAGQIIKKTDLPYFSHLLMVATTSGQFVRLGFEIGLCHDLLEDTKTTQEQLFDSLIRFGYATKDSKEITVCVNELTDIYTRKDFPFLKKAQRKKLEADRLSLISSTAQTVKYADLMDNINWVMRYDRKKAKKYLEKKLFFTKQLNLGNKDLRMQLLQRIYESLGSL
ncbi:hypothetical protein [Pedobacter rhodius]|uniref:HD domain-containing protein n=1 Tax=Pedobacter rhodius TaxID=3004098 RepID=A0ABT4KS74_9SPHI|nr:hypothetical protein [Pedobacter sp. SJ11]MCZ4221778.1 hypothetical protein [Pedobacter sp. SJ11]